LLVLDRPSRNEVRLPKGHIDEGESAAAAALRETVEEAGYTDLEIAADLGEQIVEFDYANKHYVRHERYFLMRLHSPVQVPRNETDAAQFSVRWVPLAEAVGQLTYEAEQQWVQRAAASLERLDE